MTDLLKVELPETLDWRNEKGKYTTILTNDWDSILAACAVKKVNDWDINYFYTFDGLYVLDKTDERERVGIDLALREGKTICNHLMLQDSNSQVNEQAFNLNSVKGISNNKYCTKFPLSTFLLIISAYNIPLDYSDETLMKFILSVDSAHKGFYTDNSYFKKIYTDWIEELGLTPLLDILNKTTLEEFKIIKKNTKKLGDIITIDDNGYLDFGKNPAYFENLSERFGFDIELPKQQFTKIMDLSNKDFRANTMSKGFMKDNSVFSYAFTYKDIGKVSYIN